eukprot:TRINITY_DN11503_c0_g2_i8.p2 TRINITY_DN11503_c0_g2~~TRINITY_DN11503_c0_g2_i8.p2  ORF type:complete len:111 (+),score=2.25 TRINITY_DN11503_c0_g2_i8:67-399(+)
MCIRDSSELPRVLFVSQLFNSLSFLLPAHPIPRVAAPRTFYVLPLTMRQGIGEVAEVVAEIGEYFAAFAIGEVVTDLAFVDGAVCVDYHAFVFSLLLFGVPRVCGKYQKP